MKLTNSHYVDYKVYKVMKIPERNNYGFRVALIFEDGTTQTQQKSGFHTKKQAEEARKQAIAELYNGTYVVSSRIRVDQFMDYWLEYDIRQRAGSRNTYDSYSQIVKNHINPYMGKRKLTDIHVGDILGLYQKCVSYSQSVARQVKVVMNVSFNYAVENRLISQNPAKNIELPKCMGTKPYHTRVIDEQKTLTLRQIHLLLEESKDTPIHMQVLFNVLMGLRRQEINGVKYSDVDFINKTLTVERQLGTGLNREPYAENDKSLTKQELPVKTESGNRVLPIPDMVFEAILEERKKYEKNRSRRNKDFQDLDYICCSTYGRPRSKDFHWPHYKALLKRADLPDIRWHDLRSTYCTLLLKNQQNPKAISKLMGHASEIISVDVYGDNKNIIPNEIPELLKYMDEVLPKKGDDVPDSVRDILIDISEYIPSGVSNHGHSAVSQDINSAEH